MTSTVILGYFLEGGSAASALVAKQRCITSAIPPDVKNKNSQMKKRDSVHWKKVESDNLGDL